MHPCLGSFDCTVVLFTAFPVSFCICSLEMFGNLATNFFQNKSKNIVVFSVVMVTLLYHPFFAVISLLRRNRYYLPIKSLKFSAYIIIGCILQVRDWMLYLGMIVHLWELHVSPVRTLLYRRV